MADISKEQAVRLAREAGFAEELIELRRQKFHRLIKLARNQALEDAKQAASKRNIRGKVKTISGEKMDSLNMGQEWVLDAVEAAIASLKDNTP